ncbi:DUF2934 domain-containing protein [Kaistia terrae]|jgi:cell division protein FtsL|uniref:DUF2934 domain-containing protein n=1 Tax=Kaistia terrae TaxID=537017 RepID=A0ABW0PY38_9HYPH|nr:DUF2934 domain-containing protein [Kaistia terrae]MCX5580761.1 DUF2934 domain-containing protein [Kaistia terrae]
MTQLTEQEIADEAHRLWLEEGSPEGRAASHWQQAIENLKARHPEAAKSQSAVAGEQSSPEKIASEL